MKVNLEFDAITDYKLAWLRVYMERAIVKSAEDILTPLIDAEFARLQGQALSDSKDQA